MEFRDPRRQFGAQAEAIARERLEALGYTTIATNWRFGHGELDIVMLDGDEVVFVEVKARRSEVAGRAEEGVSQKQIRSLLNTGERFMEQHPEFAGRFWRHDLVAMTMDYSGAPIEYAHYHNAIVVG